MPSSSDKDDTGLSEWQEARDILANVDGNLHDLRKYGFSFIIGLLSVDALFTVIEGSWKLAALIGTLFLIVPLNFMDRNYRILEDAASLRAQIIERRTRMNLTQTISRMWVDAKVKFVFETVYIFFILATLIVGWIIFESTSYFHLWVLVEYLVAAVGAVWVFLWQRQPRTQYLFGLIVDVIVLVMVAGVRWIMNPKSFQLDQFYLSLLINRQPEAVQLHFSKLYLHYHLFLMIAVTIAMILVFMIEGLEMNEWVDFEIDGFDYFKGDQVVAMITNVGNRDVVINDPQMTRHLPVLTVYSETDPDTEIKCEGLQVELTKANLKLAKKSVGWSDYRWLVSTKTLEPGLYRAVYKGPAYFRTGRIRRKFNLLDPRNDRDKERLKDEFGYDPWVHSAQRFRIHQEKSEDTEETDP